MIRALFPFTSIVAAAFLLVQLVLLSGIVVQGEAPFSSNTQIALTLLTAITGVAMGHWQPDYPSVLFSFFFGIYTIAAPILAIAVPDIFMTSPGLVWTVHQLYWVAYLLGVGVFLSLLPETRTAFVPNPLRGQIAQLLYRTLLPVIPLFALWSLATGIDKHNVSGIAAQVDNALPLITFFFFYRYANADPERFNGMRALLIFAALLVLMAAATGYRSFALKFGLLSLLVVHIRTRPLNGPLVMLGLALAVLVLPMTKSFDMSVQWEDYQIEVFYREFKTSARLLSVYLGEGVGTIYTIFDMISDFVHNLTFGILGSPSTIQAELQDAISETTSVGLGFSVVVSAILPFGLPGVILFPVLQAGVASYLYRRRNHSAEALLAYALFIMTICAAVRFSLPSAAASFFKVYGVSVATVFLLQAILPVKQRTNH